MLVAGVEIENEVVEELVSMLREEYYVNAADTLEHALVEDRAEVGLTIRERTAILDVLDDPPADLAQLRRVLLVEHQWRLRTGLAPRRVR
jgi:uncharacterized protein (DUF1778 family)